MPCQVWRSFLGEERFLKSQVPVWFTVHGSRHFTQEDNGRKSKLNELGRQNLERQIQTHKGYCYYYWSLYCSTILRFWADSLRSHVILHEWIAYYSAFLNIHRSGVLTALASLVLHETAAISARSVYTIQPCTMSLHAKPHTSVSYTHLTLPTSCCV